jgi:hypothetical protein
MPDPSTPTYAIGVDVGTLSGRAVVVRVPDGADDDGPAVRTMRAIRRRAVRAVTDEAGGRGGIREAGAA